MISDDKKKALSFIDENLPDSMRYTVSVLKTSTGKAIRITTRELPRGAELVETKPTEVEKEPGFDKVLSNEGINVDVINELKKADINSLDELRRISKTALTDLPHIGPATARKLRSL